MMKTMTTSPMWLARTIDDDYLSCSVLTSTYFPTCLFNDCLQITVSLNLIPIVLCLKLSKCFYFVIDLSPCFVHLIPNTDISLPLSHPAVASSFPISISISEMSTDSQGSAIFSSASSISTPTTPTPTTTPVLTPATSAPAGEVKVEFSGSQLKYIDLATTEVRQHAAMPQTLIDECEATTALGRSPPPPRTPSPFPETFQQFYEKWIPSGDGIETDLQCLDRIRRLFGLSRMEKKIVTREQIDAIYLANMTELTLWGPGIRGGERWRKVCQLQEMMSNAYHVIVCMC